MTKFQSTLSMRRATQGRTRILDSCEISIHALHEESDLTRGDADARYVISIHALHEESDDWACGTDENDFISIHALHEESDLES